MDSSENTSPGIFGPSEIFMTFNREQQLPSILADKQKFSIKRKTANNVQCTYATIHHYPEKTIDKTQNISLKHKNTN